MGPLNVQSFAVEWLKNMLQANQWIDLYFVLTNKHVQLEPYV